jgi:hypothetical protein
VSKQFDATIALQLDILRASEGVSRDVVKILRELEKELIGKIASDNLTEWGRARVNKQLKEARELIERYYDQIAVKSISDTDDIAKLAASVTASSISSAAVLPTAAVLDRIATDAVIQGAAQGAWWQKQAADVQFKFAAAVRQGLAGAETNQQIVQRVRDVMDVSKRNAATLVQTSTATIAGEAQMQVILANDDLVLRIRAYETLDSKTCIECFPAGTLVQSAGDAEHVLRGKYRGQINVITTAGGKKLRGTPNHPVLTTRGFLPIAELKPCDKVINIIFDDGVMAVRNNGVEMPSEIGAFFDLCSENAFPNIRREAASAIDLYGDGKGIDGEIDIVPINCKLRGNNKAELFKSVFDPLLSDIEFPCGLSGLDELNDLIFRVRCSRLTSEVASGFTQNGVNAAFRPACDICNQVWLHSFIEQIDDLNSVSQDVWAALASLHLRHNAMFFEQGCDCGSCGVVSASNGSCRNAFSVQLDDVVSNGTEFSECHVYTLQDSLGFYIAEGIIVKNCGIADGKEYTKDFKPIGHNIPYKPTPRHFNCRGGYLPVVIDSEPGGTRASTDGQVSASLTFEGWLERQPIERQNDILGKGRAELYRKGTITLQDLVSGRGRPLTIEQLKARYT